MKNIIWPQQLKKGDTVALIAPSSPTSLETVKIAAASLRYLDLFPKIYPSCFCSYGYLAGNDQRRADDLNAAFADEEVQGIFCLRGGYGAARILNDLDYEMIRSNPKVFCGYSDITALHTAFQQLCGFITFHSPMPSTNYMEMDDFSTDSLKTAIFAGSGREIQNPAGYPLKCECGGKAAGRLIGGNLSLLTTLLGSPYEIEAKDAVLFIEEVDEEPYKIDRALTALLLSGKLSACSGIILGSFAGCTAVDSAESLTLSEIFSELLVPLNKPIISGFACGHTYPQHTLPMGSNIEIDADNLTIQFV